MQKDYDVVIIESLRPSDRAKHLHDGRCLVGPIKLYGLRVRYVHVDTRAAFLAAIERYAGRAFAVHLSTHGDERSLQTGDDGTLTWARLARALESVGAPEVLSLSACASLAGSGLPGALNSKGLRPWLVGPSDPDGVAFDDACVAFTAFYKVLAEWRKVSDRSLSTRGSDKDMMRHALDRMHGASDGEFRYYRWSKSSSKFLYNDVQHSARRLVERFSDLAF